MWAINWRKKAIKTTRTKQPMQMAMLAAFWFERENFSWYLGKYSNEQQ